MKIIVKENGRKGSYGCLFDWKLSTWKLKFLVYKFAEKWYNIMDIESVVDWVLY